MKHEGGKSAHKPRHLPTTGGEDHQIPLRALSQMFRVTCDLRTIPEGQIPEDQFLISLRVREVEALESIAFSLRLMTDPVAARSVRDGDQSSDRRMREAVSRQTIRDMYAAKGVQLPDDDQEETA